MVSITVPVWSNGPLNELTAHDKWKATSQFKPQKQQLHKNMNASENSDTGCRPLLFFFLK